MTSQAREVAVRMLGRREYAARELRERLQHKGYESAAVVDAVEWAAREGLQSDERFAEAFARQKSARLFGPRRILAELSARGVESEVAEAAVDAPAIDWVDAAARYLQRRYAEALDTDDRGRAYQGLSRRGFTHEQAMAALSRRRD